ncbi:suppressor of loss of ypt1 [Tulasnella sp. 427]|nr:suppressor of loss of ypt1 [Tulasnella sp. 427]
MLSEKQNGFTSDDSRWRSNGHHHVTERPPPWSAYHQPGDTPPVSPKWKSTSASLGDLPKPATADHHHSLFRSVLHLLGIKATSSRPGLAQPASTAPASSSSSQPLFTSSMLRFVSLCMLWYASSALSSNTGKQIMNQFKYPVTLTFVQFGFVSGYCLLFANPWLGFTKLRKPTKAILRNTLPMAVFQVGGHIFSSMAISRVPVSTVHTIKALSPLFTVAAYALLFGVRYSARTYVSLLPLTLGVMLACSFDLTLNNALGLICAFGSAIVFVSSNIFFKKIMPSPGSSSSSTSSSHKLDKLNLLFYSSGLAFLLMIPIWAWSDLARLLDHDHHPPARHSGPAPTHGVAYYFFLNGTVHWAQNIIAFAILSSTSPVTYSIASLVKRIVVILMAIAWFRQAVHPIQGFGIAMTFAGLWMYNNAKSDVDKGENKMRRVEARMALALPTSRGEARELEVTPHGSPVPRQEEWANAGMPEYSVSSAVVGVVPPPVTTTRPQHERKSSLVPVSLMAAPPPKTTTIPNAGVAGRHAAPGPLKLDTSHRVPVRYHHPGKAGQTTSPMDSYPSPPASQDSPPQSAIPVFTVTPTPGAAANMGNNMFSHRRPTVYESSSISGLDAFPGNGAELMGGAEPVGHVPIATVS